MRWSHLCHFVRSCFYSLFERASLLKMQHERLMCVTRTKLMGWLTVSCHARKSSLGGTWNGTCIGNRASVWLRAMGGCGINGLMLTVLNLHIVGTLPECPCHQLGQGAFTQIL